MAGRPRPARCVTRGTRGRSSGGVSLRFWDTSALVSLPSDEVHSPLARTILLEDDLIVVWWGTSVEFVSVLARHERAGALTSSEISEHYRYLDALSAVWVEIQPSPSLRRLAQRLLRTHPLRAADALQLAAALTAADGDPTSLGFVCFDRRLNQAAEREGLGILGS